MANTTVDTVSTSTFINQAHRRRWLVGLISLSLAGIALTIATITYDNPMPFGTEGFWKIAEGRVTSVLVIAVVSAAHAFATVAFHTVTSNRIVTPSILGFEALYGLINTAAVFIFGIAGAAMTRGIVSYFFQVVVMVVFATLLYSWLLGSKFTNIHTMLLVGVVMGAGLASLTTFMQRMLDPNEFDVLTARLMGNISNASTEYLPYAIPIVAVVAFWIWHHARRLDTLSLGSAVSTSLGLNHRRETIKVLIAVSILMAMTTSLVGPMTFLGFLVATMAYSIADTYSHRAILPIAFLLGFVLLTGAYFVLRHIFYAQGAVTIIVELIGGLVFLIVIMRKGRL
ncbi:iron chelate uptake ABC transporter family permease subunit [Yaniella flava]|uniref:Iron chelate uptake ABC transporter family permease subunit n=1 Tax=Yaniella flava TaxID=287930 RepID=A0ABN2U4P5_9MICC